MDTSGRLYILEVRVLPNPTGVSGPAYSEDADNKDDIDRERMKFPNHS